MGEWMDGWMAKWMNRQMNLSTEDGWMDGWISGRMDGNSEEKNIHIENVMNLPSFRISMGLCTFCISSSSTTSSVNTKY